MFKKFLRFVTRSLFSKVAAKQIAELEAEIDDLNFRLLQHENHAAHLSQHLINAVQVDPITGLRNRKYFMEIEAPVFRKAKNFKATNDTIFYMISLDYFPILLQDYDACVGENLLRQFAEILKTCIRGSDVLIKYDNEEFLILAKRTSRAFAPILADRVLQLTRETAFSVSETVSIQCTCSIGYASFSASESKDRLEATIAFALNMLFEAKQKGRNCWVG
jgi:diguanylate cyclase (GGDEF)-like protein